MKKKDIKEYIIEANEKHNNKYDYSLADYKNNRTKIKIICPIHGVFEQTPSDHLKGCGCKKCANDKLSKLKSMNKKNFILKANKKHNNLYDYSKVDYINYTTKVIIICPIHGEFKQKPSIHLTGCGCQKCKNLKFSITKLKNTIQLKKDFIKKHGNFYDYSLVNYKGNKEKIKIICPIHSVFEQTPATHLRGGGCKKCSIEKRTETKEKFILKANKKHNNLYDYSKVDYINNHTEVIIICEKHGEFKQKPYNHLYNNQGCPHCKRSKGEIKIGLILNKFNIKFEGQKKFNKCINKSPLLFDFFLPKYNTCVEFDGEQHFKVIGKWGGEEGLKERKLRDEIKNKFCKQNKINLIRIKYNENIKEKLKKELIKYAII